MPTVVAVKLALGEVNSREHIKLISSGFHTNKRRTLTALDTDD